MQDLTPILLRKFLPRIKEQSRRLFPSRGQSCSSRHPVTGWDAALSVCGRVYGGAYAYALRQPAPVSDSETALVFA